MRRTPTGWRRSSAGTRRPPPSMKPFLNHSNSRAADNAVGEVDVDLTTGHGRVHDHASSADLIIAGCGFDLCHHTAGGYARLDCISASCALPSRPSLRLWLPIERRATQSPGVIKACVFRIRVCVRRARALVGCFPQRAPTRCWSSTVAVRVTSSGCATPAIRMPPRRYSFDLKRESNDTTRLPRMKVRDIQGSRNGDLAEASASLQSACTRREAHVLSTTFRFIVCS